MITPETTPNPVETLIQRRQELQKILEERAAALAEANFAYNQTIQDTIETNDLLRQLGWRDHSILTQRAIEDNSDIPDLYVVDQD